MSLTAARPVAGNRPDPNGIESLLRKRAEGMVSWLDTGLISVTAQEQYFLLEVKGVPDRDTVTFHYFDSKGQMEHDFEQFRIVSAFRSCIANLANEVSPGEVTVAVPPVYAPQIRRPSEAQR